MSRISHWTRTRLRKLAFDLLPEYFPAIAKRWQELLWGESLLAVLWGIYFIVGTPPAWVNWMAIIIALFIAGYYAWRADHSRLKPKFKVEEIRFQKTPISGGGPNAAAIYVQLVPTCLTDAPVYECQGHLLQVCRWSSNKNDWEPTEMNEPVHLAWSHGDGSPITLQPGVPRRLNVFYMCNVGERRIMPAIDYIPLRAQSVFAVDDTFRFDIKVTARDCAPVDIRLRVRRGDQWDRPVAEFDSSAASKSG
jgi:hypothetical protein